MRSDHPSRVGGAVLAVEVGAWVEVMRVAVARAVETMALVVKVAAVLEAAVEAAVTGVVAARVEVMRVAVARAVEMMAVVVKAVAVLEAAVEAVVAMAAKMEQDAIGSARRTPGTVAPLVCQKRTALLP